MCISYESYDNNATQLSKNMTMRLVYELLIICFYTYNLVIIRTHRAVKWLQQILYRWMSILLNIQRNIHSWQYPCRTHPVFDIYYSYSYPRQIVVVVSYPCLTPNPRKNMKTNMISTISVRIQSFCIPIADSQWHTARGQGSPIARTRRRMRVTDEQQK